VSLDVSRRGLFGVAADLADHHDGVRIGIGVEQLHRVEKLVPMIGSPPMPMQVDWPMPSRGQLAHRFVGQRAGARDHADVALQDECARHDADLALARRNDAGAVRPDQPRRACLSGKLPHLHHVERGNAFGDADHQRQPASAASMMASAANGGGTKITLALAPVLSPPAPRCRTPAGPDASLPPLPGVTPPTTLVP
jgi:hypothetical protein